MKEAQIKITEVSKNTMKVGDLAEKTGKTVRALRLYEELGLLEPSGRTKGQFRVYQEDAVYRVLWISKLQVLGFTLPQIKDLLSLQAQGSMGSQIMGKIRQVYAKKLKETQNIIAQMKTLEKELIASVQFLESCAHCHRTSIPHDCTHDCQRADKDQAPELIKGFNRQESLTEETHTPQEALC